MDIAAKSSPVVQRRRNADRSAETRAALVDATIQALCELGYSRTTTQEICRRAGTTAGAMQHHFFSKDALILATLEKMLETMAGPLAKFANASGSVERKCNAFVDLLWNEFYNLPSYTAVWEITVGTRGERDLFDVVRAHRRKSLTYCEKVWCSAFGLKRNHPSVPTLHFALAFMRSTSYTANAVEAGADPKKHLNFLKRMLVESVQV